MVTQKQHCMGGYIIYIEHALPIALHAGDGGEAVAIPVVEFVLLTFADEVVVVAGQKAHFADMLRLLKLYNIHFTVKGQGHYRAAANGDPTNLQPFHEPQMQAFNGMLTAIIGEQGETGTITLTAKAKGLRPARCTVKVE